MTAVLEAPLSVDHAMARVSAHLDLSKIRMKLADPEEGKGYGDDQLALMEAEYRKFLALHLMYPSEEIVPCKLVDEFWHQHILDTIAYRADCDHLFSSFLDHFPYFGMRGEADAQALHDAYANTLERYQAAFGLPPEGTWISADAAKCKRTNCKPQKCK
jgi:hypothetical protein